MITNYQECPDSRMSKTIYYIYINVIQKRYSSSVRTAVVFADFKGFISCTQFNLFIYLLSYVLIKLMYLRTYVLTYLHTYVPTDWGISLWKFIYLLHIRSALIVFNMVCLSCIVPE